jgi:hypothetical protein
MYVCVCASSYASCIIHFTVSMYCTYVTVGEPPFFLGTCAYFAIKVSSDHLVVSLSDHPRRIELSYISSLYNNN